MYFKHLYFEQVITTKSIFVVYLIAEIISLILSIELSFVKF